MLASERAPVSISKRLGKGCYTCLTHAKNYVLAATPYVVYNHSIPLIYLYIFRRDGEHCMKSILENRVYTTTGEEMPVIRALQLITFRWGDISSSSYFILCIHLRVHFLFCRACVLAFIFFPFFLSRHFLLCCE